MEPLAQQHEGEAPAAPPPPRRAYSVPEFCEAYRISRSLFYDEVRRGTGPHTFKAGKRTLVSVEAADEWRRAKEAAA